MDLIPSDSTVTTINKAPLAWIVGFLAILAGVLLGRLFFTDNGRINDCQMEKTALASRADKSDSEAKAARNELVQYLLSQKQHRQTDSLATDSVVKRVVGNKAKLIIINSQK